jgi:hypothetical protein
MLRNSISFEFIKKLKTRITNVLRPINERFRFSSERKMKIKLKPLSKVECVVTKRIKI